MKNQLLVTLIGYTFGCPNKKYGTFLAVHVGFQGTIAYCPHLKAVNPS